MKLLLKNKYNSTLNHMLDLVSFKGRLGRPFFGESIFSENRSFREIAETIHSMIDSLEFRVNPIELGWLRASMITRLKSQVHLN